MEYCVLCFNDIFEENPDSYCHQLLETCCKYLHSSIKQSSLTNALSKEGSPLCTKCFQSASEIVNLKQQMEYYQERISELVFILSLEILHRRGKSADSIDKNTPKKKLMEFDVSALSIGEFLDTSSPDEIDFSEKESQRLISDNNYPDEFFDPLLMDPPLTGNVNVKIEKSPHEFKEETLDNIVYFDDTGGEVIDMESDTNNSKIEYNQTSSEYFESSQHSPSSTAIMNYLPGSSSDRPLPVNGGTRKRKKVSVHCGSNMVKKNLNSCDDQEKRFQCLVCFKRFKRGEHLKVHTRSHTGERPYSCDLCSTSCQTKQGLFNHKRIHTGEQPHVCSFCGSKFTHESSLLRHIKIHTGERPHKCDECDYATVASDRLKKHKTHVHGKDFKTPKLVTGHFKRNRFALEFTKDCAIKKHK